MGVLYRIALVLVIIGAINWGLIGLFRFDLVAALFGGQTSGLSRIIYSLVGLAGLISIPLLFRTYEEDEEAANRSYGNAYTNTNYQTEFGKEADFSDVKKDRTTNGKSESRATELYDNDRKGDKDKLV
ncbi:DUF378 domain-containing protein [Lysinibacillus yapensis]|uniref:DUF378 domain-containing protein n=1 Tax=Ureibacillus yapensis TaxID=2304605 RepID=A0A396SB85_9BACL|nr:DUF378 domain-containing protein [Lysinibacillus yapensis]RHW38363.1 DUF378 domain-containing protein [Lysinibacillus yapensis]